MTKVTVAFTRKEYKDVQKSLELFKIVSSEPAFTDLLQKVVKSKDTVVTEKALELLLYTNKSVVEKAKEKAKKTPKEGTNAFLAPKEATENCRKLFNKIQGDENIKLTFESPSELTCIADVNKMLKVYREKYLKKTDSGVFADKFLLKIAPRVFSETTALTPKTRGMLPWAILEKQEKT
jgi:hypothetical protein